MASDKVGMLQRADPNKPSPGNSGSLLAQVGMTLQRADPRLVASPGSSSSALQSPPEAVSDLSTAHTIKALQELRAQIKEDLQKELSVLKKELRYLFDAAPWYSERTEPASEQQEPRRTSFLTSSTIPSSYTVVDENGWSHSIPLGRTSISSNTPAFGHAVADMDGIERQKTCRATQLREGSLRPHAFLHGSLASQTWLSEEERASERFIDNVNLGSLTEFLAAQQRCPERSPAGESPRSVAGQRQGFQPEVVEQTDDLLRVFRAAGTGNREVVKEWLEAGGDPNVHISEYKETPTSKLFQNCGMLPVACMKGHMEVINLLIDAGVNLDSRYGFEAGSRKLNWSGTAPFAVVAKGNLSLLRKLIEEKADPHAESSTRANLLWQCCYIGRTDMAKYLLELNVSHSVAGESQDNTVSYTPLHMATVQGHEELVCLLLEAKAKANIENEDNDSPLSAAIRLGQHGVMRNLIKSGALLVDDKHRRDDEIEGGHKSMLSSLFEKNNPVLVHAAASGLSNQANQVKLLHTDDLLEFLNIGHTDSLRAILEAIFVAREIRYRDERNQKVVYKTAFQERHEMLSNGAKLLPINAIEAEHSFEKIEQMFNSRKQPDGDMKKFFHRLMPQNPQHWLKRNPLLGLTPQNMTSIVVFESLVPDFHRDLRIIKAMKDVSSAWAPRHEDLPVHSTVPTRLTDALLA
jgi:ankyrin repeat protein